MTAQAVYSDSHAHLSYVQERLGQAMLEEVVRQYSASQARILDPGVDYDDFGRRLASYGHYPFVRLAAGIWPDPSTLPSIEEALAELETWVAHPSCIAVGEAGLDYHWMHGSTEQQAELFEGQLRLAKTYNKPIIVHSRDAAEDTLRILKPLAASQPVLLHCFGYDEAAARDFLDAGCYLSFAGNLSYPRNDALRTALQAVPPERLLLETDAPYMNPLPRRGRPSSPLDISRTYVLAAELRGIGVGELAEQLERNARQLFGAAW